MKSELEKHRQRRIKEAASIVRALAYGNSPASLIERAKKWVRETWSPRPRRRGRAK